MSKTVRYLLYTGRTSGLDGETVVRPGSWRSHSEFVHRLEIWATPKVRMDDGDWNDLLSNAAGCAFFCDSSFIDEDSDLWWRSLLRSPNLIFLIPHVMRESGEWLKHSSQHAASEAISSSDPKLILSNLKDLSSSEQATFIYYTHLLAVRKKLMSIPELATARDHEERREQLHQSLGARGYLLATKGQKLDWSESTAYTDEALVVLAAMHAIGTGQETVILTRDEDVMEQFYKCSGYWNPPRASSRMT